MHNGTVERLGRPDPLVLLLPRLPRPGLRARHGLLPAQQAGPALRQPGLRQRFRRARRAVRLRPGRSLRQPLLRRLELHATRQRQLRHGRVLRPGHLPAQTGRHRVPQRRAGVRSAGVLHGPERVLPGRRVQDRRRDLQHRPGLLLPGQLQDPQRPVQAAVGTDGGLVGLAVLRDEQPGHEERQLRVQPDRQQGREQLRQVS